MKVMTRQQLAAYAGVDAWEDEKKTIKTAQNGSGNLYFSFFLHFLHVDSQVLPIFVREILRAGVRMCTHRIPNE